MQQPLRIVLATRNPGKVVEMAALLDRLPVELLPVSAFPGAPEVEEDQASLAGNARKKALALQEHTNLAALADDTGLEVDALEGRPGVHSARFAGPTADDAANRERLLRELDGVEDRRARFRTVITFATGDAVHHFEGVCEGRITEEERGGGGFGYDTLFVPEGHSRTFAELSADEKNAISHRRRALDKFAAFLKEASFEGPHH